MPGLFVTATGTDVGKTFVTAGLLRAGRRANVAMRALKPVLSGYAEADAATSDAGMLLKALGRGVDAASITAMSPWRFAASLSPDMAAQAEGRCIDFDAVVRDCRDAGAVDTLTLFEGVGGVMVPINTTHTILDLIETLRLPALLVSATNLGAISHCLTAVESLRGRGVSPLAIVLNESAGSTVPLDATRATLTNFCGATPILVCPRDAGEPAFDHLFADLVRLDPDLRPRA